MITADQYFKGREHSAEQETLADDLLSRVNALIAKYEKDTGNEVPQHSHTNSRIAPAGSKDLDQVSGIHEGGFRFPDCPQGSLHSSHKILDGKGAGVDVYDPDNEFDDWITDEVLEEFGLYREHPDSTDTWCHLTNRSPNSGHRTFFP